MKKLIFSALVVTGLSAFAPLASAHSERVFIGYDRCGRPVYEEVCRQEYRYYDSRPSYYAPSRRYYEDRGYDRSNCRDSRSRLSFSFGF